MASVRVEPVTALRGSVRVPPDKSLTHRALLFGAISDRAVTVERPLDSADIAATLGIIEACGVTVEGTLKDRLVVHGAGMRGLRPPMTLDCMNAGTLMRLLIGILVGQPADKVVIDGDDSLRGRPMNRVAEPLRTMGAAVWTAPGGTPPLVVSGGTPLRGQAYDLDVASAQVKSCLLLAGMYADGETWVKEPSLSRDHTERMLKAFGADLEVVHTERGQEIILNGPAELTGQKVTVPADPSSAAFPMVAALLTEGSDLTQPNMMMNPTRTGLLGVLKEMGANIEILNSRDAGGETLADVRVRSSRLKGVSVSAEVAPSMIDEFPILAVAAACAEGKTEMRGLDELRVKESDRLAAIVDGLKANGVEVQSGEDWMIVEGAGSGRPSGGGTVATHMDHRIAMAFLVLGLVSEQPVTVDDGEMIGTSFPDFVELMQTAGARIEAAEAAA